MNTLERLAYLKNLVGDPSPEPWTSGDDLFGYFQRFRPDGDGVERVFEGMAHGDEVLARLLPFYRHTRDAANYIYFVVRDPLQTTRQELSAIMNRHLAAIRQIAVAGGNKFLDKLDTLLPTVRVEFERGKPPPHPPQPEPNAALPYEIACDWSIDLRIAASDDYVLLGEAFYSIACDYQLADYIVWPVYRDASPVHDPFAAAFDL
jgi:hypothetical protein